MKGVSEPEDKSRSPHELSGLILRSDKDIKTADDDKEQIQDIKCRFAVFHGNSPTTDSVKPS